MYGDSILAGPFTITGSIGAVSVHLYDRGFGDKLGLNYDHVQRGEHADLGGGMRLPLFGMVIPDRPMTEAEQDQLRTLMEDLYDEFVAKVAEGRDMSVEEVRAVGGGRFYSGITGKEKGLVDEVGGLWESLRLAKAAAGLPPGRTVEFVEAPEIGTFPWSMLKPSLISLGQRLTLSSDEEEQTPSVPLIPEEAVAADRPWALPAADSWAARLLGAAELARLTRAEQVYLEHALRSPGRPLLLSDPVHLGGSLGSGTGE
jgi:ClpP class serine protease